MHRRSVPVVLALVAAAAFAATGVVSAADEWLGKWTLNLTKSKFDPPELAPKSLTLTWEAVDGGMRMVQEGVDAQGQPIRLEYLAKFDSKDYPWTASPNADTVQTQKLDDEYYQTMWKKGAEVTLMTSTLVSKDRRSLITTQTGKDAQGRDIHYHMIFDRQP